MIQDIIAYAEPACDGLCNPLGETFGSIPGFVKGLLSVAMYIGVPFIGLVLVWAGFKFLFSRGKSDGITSAWFNFRWVIVGVGVFLGAWALSVLVDSTIKDILR